MKKDSESANRSTRVKFVSIVSAEKREAQLRLPGNVRLCQKRQVLACFIFARMKAGNELIAQTARYCNEYTDRQTMRRGRTVNWKTRLMTVAALVLVAAWRPRLSEYLVEEALTVLLCIAALLLTMLCTVIALLLVWQGASLVFHRLKVRIERIASVRDRRSRVEHATSHPLTGA